MIEKATKLSEAIRKYQALRLEYVQDDDIPEDLKSKALTEICLAINNIEPELREPVAEMIGLNYLAFKKWEDLCRLNNSMFQDGKVYKISIFENDEYNTTNTYVFSLKERLFREINGEHIIKLEELISSDNYIITEGDEEWQLLTENQK